MQEPCQKRRANVPLLQLGRRRRTCHYEEARGADAAIRFLFGGPASGGGILWLQRTPGRNNQGFGPGPGAPRRCGSGGLQDLIALRARFGLVLEANRAAWFKVASPEIIQVSPGHLDPAAHHSPRLESSCYLKSA